MLTGMSGTPYTPPVTRRTVTRSAITAGVVAVVALALLIPAGYPGWALFGIVGLALGLANAVLAVVSVTNFANARPSKARFMGSVLTRLAVITVIAFVCALAFRPSGFGVFGGLAVYQFVLVVCSMLPLIKEIRQK
jgi:heme O synthase-like polyprenyltransferase